MPAHDQCIPTNAYNVSNSASHSQHKFDEIFDHLVSRYPVRTEEEIIRHDKLGKYIHWHVCQSYANEVPATNTPEGYHEC